MSANFTLIHIKERSSIRAYQERPLTSEETRALEEAALAAPTARNRQDLRFAFITDKKLVAEMDKRIFHFCDPEMAAIMTEREADSFFYGAPLAIVIFGKDRPFVEIDAGIAVQTLALAAQSMGLSSVILGMPRLAFQRGDADNCRKLLALEDDEEFCIAIAIGHAATSKEPHEHRPELIRHYD